MICLILIYRSKAGYKIYGVEILREEKSRMDPFKKTALSIPPSGGVNPPFSRFRGQWWEIGNINVEMYAHSTLWNTHGWKIDEICGFFGGVTQCLAFDLSRHAYYLRDIYRWEKYRSRLIRNKFVISYLFIWFDFWEYKATKHFISLYCDKTCITKYLKHFAKNRDRIKD